LWTVKRNGLPVRHFPGKEKAERYAPSSYLVTAVLYPDAVARRPAPRFDAGMVDNRTISQLEAEGYPWIGCECCKGTVWVPFRMLRERIPMLSAMTLDQLGARMRCDKCGKRPERYYPAKGSH
jgi:hypothetical protein